MPWGSPTPRPAFRSQCMSAIAQRLWSMPTTGPGVHAARWVPRIGGGCGPRGRPFVRRTTVTSPPGRRHQQVRDVPQSLAALSALSGNPGALVILGRHRGHEMVERVVLERFPWPGDGQAPAPAAGRSGRVTGFAHGPVRLGTLGALPTHHRAPQGMVTARTGGALGPPAPQASWQARAVPCRHQQDAAQAKNPGCGWLFRPCGATGCLVPRGSAWRPSPKRARRPFVGAGKVATRSCANQRTRRWTVQEAAWRKRPKRHAVLMAGVHLAIAAKVVRPGEPAGIKMRQQHRSRWRPRQTMGLPRQTMGTQPGKEVQAISLCRALSRGGRAKKAANGSSPVAFTPFVIDFQAVYGLGCQF